LGFNTLCDILFGLFVVVWLATRHVFFLMVIKSVYYDVPAIVPQTCFQGGMDSLQGSLPQPSGWSWLLQPFMDPEGLICFNQSIFNGFFTYLVTLQGIMCIWSYAILKVVVKVLRGQNAEDIRSDDEEEEEVSGLEKGKGLEELDEQEEHEKCEEEYRFLEEEADVDDGIVKAWQRRHRVSLKKGGSSSALHIPGHSDRKEFLNRIGCEKQID
jgi:acyl-CoA-dependent ceramide synthase